MTSRGPGGRGSRVLRLAAGAVAVAAVAVAARELLSDGSTGGAPSPRPDLRRWDLVGCYDLRTGPWSVQWREAGGSGGGGDPSPGGDVPPSFSPPGRIVLLPDSVDRWGRALPSRRAEPLEGTDPPGRSMRWLVRADTLWLVWSEGDTRAGVALRRSGDSLAGRVRTIRGADSLDATATASAWPVNCWTGGAEVELARRGGRR